ncbi:diaminopimelate decarboxylase family protein [Kitasatospora sp. NPDC093550]|uniref:diaminopimelate decarboxylase family protein n=1 Tax=Kitasatospora sp. NPDC093550 TaxID=3364089 RepID=UPI0038226DDF
MTGLDIPGRDIPGGADTDTAPGREAAPDWDYARLAGLAARHGTPLQVLDATRLDRAVDELLDALDGLGRPTRVYYSVKTNYLPYLCRRLAARGLGADVVSGYELAAALEAGFAPADTVFNGPVKTEAELAAAFEHGVRVNLDGEQEVEVLERLAARAGRTVEVGIRISPGLPLSTSVDPSYRAQAERAARRNRFGWPAGSPQLDRMVELIADAPHLRLTAVHAHLSSQIVHRELLLAALDVVLAEAARLHVRFGLSEVNIGGGFGVPGIRRPRSGPLTALWGLQGGPAPVDEEPRLDVAELLSEVDKRMAGLGLDGVALACEPGRWLVSEPMALVTSVASRKELPDARWLILDAGHNMAPWAGSGEVHRIVPIGREFTERTATWSVAGPLCFENDIHDQAVELPADLAPGDLVCLHDTGAYSLGRSNNFIRTRGAVVALDGELETEVWAAETGADVFRLADPHRAPADPGPVR